MSENERGERCEAICTKCGKLKHPTKAYLWLCKFQNQPYICQACRASMPPPPMDLGELGSM
jgi:hypothetical protein